MYLYLTVNDELADDEVFLQYFNRIAEKYNLNLKNHKFSFNKGVYSEEFLVNDSFAIKFQHGISREAIHRTLFSDQHSRYRDTAFIEGACLTLQKSEQIVPKELYSSFRDFVFELEELVSLNNYQNKDETVFQFFIKNRCEINGEQNIFDKNLKKKGSGFELCIRKENDDGEIEIQSITIPYTFYWGTTLTEKIRNLSKSHELNREWKCAIETFYKNLKTQFYCGISEEIINILIKNNITILHTTFTDSIKGVVKARIRNSDNLIKEITFIKDDNKSFVEGFRNKFGRISTP